MNHKQCIQCNDQGTECCICLSCTNTIKNEWVIHRMNVLHCGKEFLYPSKCHLCQLDRQTTLMIPLCYSCITQYEQSVALHVLNTYNNDVQCIQVGESNESLNDIDVIKSNKSLDDIESNKSLDDVESNKSLDDIGQMEELPLSAIIFMILSSILYKVYTAISYFLGYNKTNIHIDNNINFINNIKNDSNIVYNEEVYNKLNGKVPRSKNNKSIMALQNYKNIAYTIDKLKHGKDTEEKKRKLFPFLYKRNEMLIDKILL